MNNENNLYSLCLDNETKRIICITFDEFGLPDDPRVTELPAGNIADYLYINGEYIYDPLPQPELILGPIEILQTEVAELKSQNEMLLECLLEMSEEVYN